MKTFKQFIEQMIAPGNPIKGANPLDLRTADQKLELLKKKGEFYKKHDLYKYKKP